MKVLDMGAGGGYSTELMARAVGRPARCMVRTRPTWGAGENAVRGAAEHAGRKEHRELEPALRRSRAREVMISTSSRFFLLSRHHVHERRCAAMNRKLFGALKPGGMLVIADHSARRSDGTSVGKTFHRIAESALRGEVEAAGFKLVAEGDFWRHPDDSRDF